MPRPPGSGNVPMDRQLEVAIMAERTTDQEAATHYGLARRHVSAIRNRWKDSPVMQAMKAKLADRVLADYAELEWLAIERTRKALQDPATEPRDIARLLEVVARNRQLAAGEATSRTEVDTTTPVMDISQKADLVRWLDEVIDASDEDITAWAASGGLEYIRNQETPLLGDGES